MFFYPIRKRPGLHVAVYNGPKFHGNTAWGNVSDIFFWPFLIAYFSGFLLFVNGPIWIPGATHFIVTALCGLLLAVELFYSENTLAVK